MNKPIDPKLYGGKGTQSALAISLKPIKPGQKRQIIRVPEKELPLAKELGPQEVLCMVYMCQICDTDVELGTNAGHGAPTIGFSDEDGDALVLNGHEAGAVVIATGEEVDRVEIGDWASLKVREGMKSTECIMCQAGMSHRCLNWQYEPADMEEHGIFRAPGWFCQYSVLDQRQVIKIPDGLKPEYASMGEPLSIGANAFMTAIDRWWGDPGFLEETDEGPPAIAVIGAGGIASIDAPIFSEWPENILEAMATGEIPDNYLDRPYPETRRKMAGLPPKKPAKAEVFYYARTPYKPGLLKADAVKPLGIKYESFEDMGLPYIEVVEPPEKEGDEPWVRKVYNLTSLMEHPTRKRFDLVIEMCTSPHQIARMMLPPSDPGEVEAFLSREVEEGKDPRCEGRYHLAPGTDAEAAMGLIAPKGGHGGLMGPGTKLVITSITGGDELYPNFPVAKFCWAATLNNSDIAGVVNYDEFHTRVGLLSLAMITRKEGLEEWPRTVQERVVEDADEMLGEGMYDLKKSCSGRVAVVMNSRESIEETLKVAKGNA
jgi:hypothetical protein